MDHPSRPDPTPAQLEEARTGYGELVVRLGEHKDSAPFATLVAAFLAAYGSEKTRRAYAADLVCWWRWCRTHQVKPLQAGRLAVEAYLRSLELGGLAPSTVARRLSTLSGVYQLAVDEDLIDRSPVSRVRRPKVPADSQTLGLDRDELRRFLDTAEASGARDHALACLLGLNGLRVSEACGATLDDLDATRGHRVLVVTRKGGARVSVPLAPRTAAAIDQAAEGRTTGPLLLANDGGPLDRYDAARIVRRLARRAELGKRISPHSLRHSFVTAALDAGVALRDVQDAAGHADPRTTRRYDRGRQSLDRHATYAVAAYLAG